MVKRLILILITILVLILLLPNFAQAQEEQPIVYVVLFYSPSCGHCHAFITEDLPVLQEIYGDQLALIGVDTSQEAGYQLFLATYAYFEIERSPGVPTFVCGDQVIIGRRTDDLITLIDAGIEAGGVPFPEIPALVEAYGQAMAEQPPQSTPEPESPNVAAEEEINEPQSNTLADRLARDPVGNGLSIAILLGLAITLGAGIMPGFRRDASSEDARLGWLTGFPQWLAVLITAVFGLGIAATLVLQAGSEATSTVLAIAALVGMTSVVGIVLITAVNREEEESLRLPQWVILVVIFAGLAAAIYLAYIEVSQDEAVCGVVGDCNAVNQSDFALIFGVLPVGTLGVIGYIVILLAWIVSKAGKDILVDLANTALLGMTLFGVAFSTYLTFLEPFVIGATCAWCLTSALAMMMILWLTATLGWRSLLRLLGRP